MVAAHEKSKQKNNDKSVLLALSGAALSLPGINANADSPQPNASSIMQFGHYQEEGGRMEADVYHQKFTLPIKDYFEFTVDVNKDVYVGASPYFTVPTGASDAISAASNIDPFSLGVTVIDQAQDVAQQVIDDILSGAIPPTNVNTEVFRRLINAQTIDLSKNPKQILASHPLETRNKRTLGASAYLGPVTLNLSGGRSKEDDYESSFGLGKVTLEFNEKLTAISAEYGFSNNDIKREAVQLGGPHDHSTGDIEDFRDSNTSRSHGLGLVQVLNKNSLIHLNSYYIKQRGYLSNPYKLVNIKGEITAEEYNDAAFVSGGIGSDWSAYTDLEVAGFELFREVRPDERDQWIFAAGINQHLPKLDASVHLDYRYYTDDWDINSHTFELTWYQRLPFGITLTPNIRYYTQTSAEFFEPFFLSPREDGFYSSDYRLSGFGKLSAGLVVRKEFSKNIFLDLGYEYSTQRESLKWGASKYNGYADLDSYLLSAALQVDLSSFASKYKRNKHPHKGNHHPLPAGVMFGHMLKNAGDFMLGYHLMHSDWSGGYQTGNSTNVTEQEIINNACDDGDCEFRAQRMRMNMHMLNFMYAPTDWLNLIVAPQFADKRMEMVPLPNSTVTEGGSHESDGLGDIFFAALFKLLDSQNYHAHLGIGLSAPTGRVDVTFDGFQDNDSQLQSFGMQLGSGTWDFKPSLTFTAEHENWYWGTQLNATKRLESRNKSGYALGDEYQINAWMGYQLSDWIALTLRNSYKVQSEIKGRIDQEIIVPAGQTAQLTPLENPDNFGGKFWDVGIGLNLSVPSGEFAGHSLAIEWLQPIDHDLNGYQLERGGILNAKWTYRF